MPVRESYIFAAIRLTRTHDEYTVVTMDTLEFLLIIASFGVILYWYLQNANADIEGARGLLAFTLNDEEAGQVAGKSYKVKERTLPQRHTGSARSTAHTNLAEKPTSYRVIENNAQMRRRFRRQDEVRYRIKDKASNYKVQAEDEDRA